MKLLIKSQTQLLVKNFQKKFSILHGMTESISLNRLIQINDIHPSKVYDLNETKKKPQKLSQGASKKEYLFEREHNPDEYIDINDIIENTQPALYSKLINNIVEKPYYMFNYGEHLVKHPLIFKEILFKSTIPTILNSNNQTQLIISLNQLIKFLKYIKFIFNYQIYISDLQILGLIKKSFEVIEILRDPEEIINYSKELIDVRNILKTVSINKEFIDKIIQSLDISLKKKFYENVNLISKYINQLENEMKSDNFELKFYKFIYCLGKIQSFFKNDNSSIIENLSQKTNNSLSVLIHNFNLSKLEKKAIIVYLSYLDSLKMSKEIPSLISQKLTLESFDLEDFNILYKVILNKYKDYISAEELVSNFFNVFPNQLKLFDITKIKYFYDTILFVFKNICSSVYFYNNPTYSNRYKVFLMKEFFKNGKDIMENNSDDKNSLFYFLNLAMEIVSNPSSLLNKRLLKNLNIFDIDKGILIKFVNQLIYRLNYIWRFDHEIFLLGTTKNIFLEINNKNIDDILKIFLIQIVNNYENSITSSNTIDSEYIQIATKIISYFNSLDNYYEEFKVEKDITESIERFKKCLEKNADSQFRKLSEYSSENLCHFSSIFLPLVYYSNSHILSKTFNDEEFSELVIDKYLKYVHSISIDTDQLIEIYNNILEFYISYPESELKILSPQNKQILNYLFNQIKKNVLKLDSKGKLEQSCLKRRNNSSDIKFIEFLLNYLFIFRKLNIKNENAIYIERFIERSTILRNLKSNNLIKFNDYMLTFNSLAQIVSNLQTITIFNSKPIIFSNYLNNISIKAFFITIINNIHKHNLLENDIKNQIFNFSPLSSLSCLIFDELDIEDLIKLLKILGNKNLENYHPSFALKLTENYCNEEKLKQIYMKNEDNLFNLAFNWPFFLKNEEILKLILSIDELKLLRIEMINISNVISYHHTIHPKLLDFVIMNIEKLKREEQNEFLDNYINNCAYLGYRMSSKLYQKLLSLYNSLNMEVSQYNFEIISDLLMISVISDINIDYFTSESKEIFIKLCAKLEDFLNNKINTKYNNQVISYYPSIPSEDRYFHKAISNNFYYLTLNQQELNKQSSQKSNKDEIINEETEASRKSYMRKGRESSVMEEEYESFFTKKKDLMYGNQSLLQDEFKIKPILKYWLLTNFFMFRYEEDTILSEEFNRVFYKILDSYKKNRQFEKLYLNLLSFCMQNKILLDTNYFIPSNNINVDYYLTINDKNYIIIFVPQNHLCLNHMTNEYEMDGLYKLITSTLTKSNPNIKIIHLFENMLMNINDEDLKMKFYQKINVLE